MSTDPRLNIRTWLLGYGDSSYPRTSPALLIIGIRHRLTGARRGCSCTRCFSNPRRRVPPAEIYRDRARLAKLEESVRKIERGAR